MGFLTKSPHYFWMLVFSRPGFTGGRELLICRWCAWTTSELVEVAFFCFSGAGQQAVGAAGEATGLLPHLQPVTHSYPTGLQTPTTGARKAALWPSLGWLMLHFSPAFFHVFSYLAHSKFVSWGCKPLRWINECVDSLGHFLSPISYNCWVPILRYLSLIWQIRNPYYQAGNFMGQFPQHWGWRLSSLFSWNILNSEFSFSLQQGNFHFSKHFH